MRSAELFPKIDYFLIGIGAYEPRWFMEPNHNNPTDASRRFSIPEHGHLVPMHYGTFDLSDEPPSQPLRLVIEEAERNGSQTSRGLEINERCVCGGHKRGTYLLTREDRGERGDGLPRISPRPIRESSAEKI